MGIEDFITDALDQPSDYIAYHVSRELAKLHPGKAVVEEDTGHFDLEAFVRAGQCTVVNETSIFNQERVSWDEVMKKPERKLVNGWLNVLWRGSLFDVVMITWTLRGYTWRHHWIIAQTRELAEALISEVCARALEVREEVLVFQDGYWEKDEQLFKAIAVASFDDLILQDSLKEEIQSDLVNFFESRELYERYRIPWKRGALFIGPPGNGKTHTLKALINQIRRPCLYVKGFKSEYNADEENLRTIFQKARSVAPCLIIFEDLDTMVGDGTRTVFLNELDGFQVNSGVVVLATTNHPGKLDPAIVDRPSRFDRKFYFHLPAEGQRSQYIKVWNMRLQPELRLSEAVLQDLVHRTQSFSFAYLKELFVSSLMQWMATGGTHSMDQIVISQSEQLRAQRDALAASATGKSEE